MTRRSAFTFAAGCLLLLGVADPAAALDWPTRTVRFITPAPAGGGTDLTLRVFADKLSKEFGHQVVVENRPGGEGLIASSYVVKSAPDGYTFLGTFDSHTTNPTFQESLPYDTLKDFAPVGMLASVSMMLVAAPNLPASSVQELVTLAKSKPGQLTYASIGRGSSQYVVAEMFNAQSGAGLMHVPYKERATMTGDVMAGRVDVMVSSIAGVLSYLQNGTLKPIAVTTRKRSPVIPNVPTLDEAGLPGYEFISWVGLLAPAGVPREIIDKLSMHLKKAAALPDVQERIAKSGSEVTVTSPEEYDARIRADIVKWNKLFKK